MISDNISVGFFTLQISVIINLCSAFAHHPFRNLRSFWIDSFFLEHSAVRFPNLVSLFRVQLYTAIIRVCSSRLAITSSADSIAVTVKSATSLTATLQGERSPLCPCSPIPPQTVQCQTYPPLSKDPAPVGTAVILRLLHAKNIFLYFYKQ